MSDLSQPGNVTNLRCRRLEREALGPGDESCPLSELLVRGLYVAGISMILASLFL